MEKPAFERGQLLPILAVALIAILAVAALAIDGTITYSDRRNSQSTADSAAISGAGAAAQVIKDYPPSELYCGGSLAQSAAQAAIQGAQLSASLDNIYLSENNSDPTYIEVTCAMGAFSYYLDIHIQVTSQTIPGLGAIVRKEPITSVVHAVSRVYPKQNIAFGNAIASLSKSCDDGGIYLDGNSQIIIHNGGVFSNSCLEGKGHIDLLVEGASIRYVGDYVDAGAAIFDPEPIKSTDLLPSEYIDPPDCSGMTNYGAATHGGDLAPGIYSEIAVNEGEVLTMKNGLYCLDGDFRANGHAQVDGTNITIYMRQGMISLEGTALVNLSAPNCETSLCGVPRAIRGLLIFVDPENSSDVLLSGTPFNSFSGTIFAPESLIHVTGTEENITMDTQIVGRQVTVTGNVDFTMDLDAANIYQNPSSVELLH